MLIFVVGMMVVNLLGELAMSASPLSWLDICVCVCVCVAGNTFLLTQLYIYVEPLVVVLSFLPPFHLVSGTQRCVLAF